MVSIILIILVSIFFPGIIIITKNITSGRKGPSILQPIKDIVKLLRKGAVYSRTTSFVFQIAPIIYFSSIIMAILFIPFGGKGSLLSFKGDFIMFAYLLAFGKFFMIISALDTGSSFEGMGASREATFSMLIEPAFFVLLSSFVLLTGHTSFSDIYASIHYESYFSYLLGILASVILVLIAMVENSRMPLDDPKTHLELTMIHEVMILDNSGFDLGIIMLGNNLKFAMYGALISNFFITGLPLLSAIIVFTGIQIFFAFTIGIVESFMARFRMNHNPQYILIIVSLSILLFIGAFMTISKTL